jgi:hypothetical protein
VRPLRLLVLVLVGLTAVTGGYLWQRRADRDRHLERLESRRETLRLRLAALRAGGDALADAPGSQVALGIPSGYAGELVRAVTTRLLDRVVLNLSGIRVRKQGEVRAKLLVARVKAGTWHLDLTIQRLSAVLRPGEPEMDFGGGSDRVAAEFPVRVEEGQGHARLRFRWDSAGVANLACRDFEVEQRVEGRVVPREYLLRGEFFVTADGDAIAVQPRFAERTIEVQVEPSAATWRGVRAALDSQDTFWRCGVALKPEEIEEQLRELVARGFEVRLPDSLFRQVRLPAAVSGTLRVGDRDVQLNIRPTALKLTTDMLWYGADLETRLGDESGARPVPGGRR